MFFAVGWPARGDSRVRSRYSHVGRVGHSSVGSVWGHVRASSDEFDSTDGSCWSAFGPAPAPAIQALSRSRDPAARQVRGANFHIWEHPTVGHREPSPATYVTALLK